MRHMSKLFEALVDGNKLTDEEVKALYKQLTLVTEACAPLGPNFRLAHKEAAVQCAYLRDIMFNRGIIVS